LASIWQVLGKMEGTEIFDLLPEHSKYLALSVGQIFLKSGGLDVFFSWSGENVYAASRISLEDYLKNLTDYSGGLNKKIKDFEIPFLVEDRRNSDIIEKLVTIKEGGEKKQVKIKSRRANINPLGLFSHFLFHMDSEGRQSVVGASIHTSSRLFNSEMMANLLIMTENSLQKGELKNLTADKVWNQLINNKSPDLKDTLLTGLQIEVGQNNFITKIKYRDFSQFGENAYKELMAKTEPVQKELMAKTEPVQAVWAQFIRLYLEAFEECNTYKEEGIYPHFFPALILQGFVIRSGQAQQYNETLKKYVTKKYPPLLQYIEKKDEMAIFNLILENLSQASQYINDDELLSKALELEKEKLKTKTEAEKRTLIKAKRSEIIDKIKKLKSASPSDKVQDISLTNKAIQYALFDAKNFSELKSNLLKIAGFDSQGSYFKNGYMLHWLVACGITPQRYVAASYSIDDYRTPIYSNCVETGIFNFFALYIPFNQYEGTYNNSKIIPNTLIQNYIKKANFSTKTFTEEFLINRPWIPYVNLQVLDNPKNILPKGYYIGIPNNVYSLVKEKIDEKGLKIVDKSAEHQFDCFKVSCSDVSQKHSIDCDVLFVKESPSINLYEVRSGLMSIHLFERMIYSQKSNFPNYENLALEFIKIITDFNKAITIPKDFKYNMDNYLVGIREEVLPNAGTEVWYGQYKVQAQQNKHSNLLAINLNINPNHTEVTIKTPEDTCKAINSSFTYTSSISKFLTNCFYISSQEVIEDNFECQNWISMFPTLLNKETIAERKWDFVKNQYQEKSVMALPQGASARNALYIKLLEAQIGRKEDVDFHSYSPAAREKTFLSAFRFYSPHVLEKLDIFYTSFMNENLNPKSEIVREIILFFQQAVSSKNIHIAERMLKNLKNNAVFLELFTQQINSRCENSFHLISQENQNILLKSYLEALKNIPSSIEVFFMRDFHGKTPLHTALAKNNIEFINMYLEAFKNHPECLQAFVLQDNLGDTLLHIALKQNNVEFIKRYSEFFKDQPQRFQPFILSDDQGDTPLPGLSKVFELKNKQGKTPIHIALKKNRLNLVNNFLEICKKDINFIRIFSIQDHHNDTPLHVALKNNNVEFIEAYLEFFKDHPNFISVFHLQNDQENTLLHLCFNLNKTKVLEKIINLFKKPEDLLRILELTDENKNSVMDKIIQTEQFTLLENIIKSFPTQSTFRLLHNSLLKEIKEKDSFNILKSFARLIEIYPEILENPINDASLRKFIDVNNLWEKYFEFIQDYPLKNIQVSAAQVLLEMAVRQNNIKNIEECLRVFKNHPNFEDILFNLTKEGNSILHLAVKNRQYEVIRVYYEIFKNNAAALPLFFIKNKDGDTPLNLILPKGVSKTTEIVHIIYLEILRLHGKADLLAIQNNNKENFLHLIIRENISLNLFEQYLKIVRNSDSHIKEIFCALNNEKLTPYQEGKKTEELETQKDNETTQKLKILQRYFSEEEYLSLNN